jgi:hypothetical protein
MWDQAVESWSVLEGTPKPTEQEGQSEDAHECTYADECGSAEPGRVEQPEDQNSAEQRESYKREFRQSQHADGAGSTGCLPTGVARMMDGTIGLHDYVGAASSLHVRST